MDVDEIRARLRGSNRAKVSRETGIRYMYLQDLMHGRMKRPGAAHIDRLRSYYLSQDVRTGKVVSTGAGAPSAP